MQAVFFPSGVAACSAEPWMWEKPVAHAEENLLSRTAADKRLREFRAGRHCAHNVLEKLGHKDFSVLRGERGEPLWPEGICGSISHAGERCIAIAAKKVDYLSLGVDIEKDREIKDDTLERISHAQERIQLEQAPVEFQDVNLRAVLFSIKESVHKVYYPLNRHTLDFLDVDTVIDWEKKKFLVNILAVKPAANHMLENLSGCFDCDKGYVYSRICLKKDGSCV